MEDQKEGLQEGMNKKARSKIPLKPKSPFKWFFMDIIPSTAPKSLTSDTNVLNYILFVDTYSRIQKNYGMDKITRINVILRVLYMLQVYVALLDHHPRLSDI